MLEALYRKFEPRATWIAVTLLFIGYFLCTAGFNLRHNYLKHNEILDTSPLYGSEYVKSLFLTLGNHNVRVYGITEVTLDLAFPLIYSMFFLFLIIRLFPAERAKYLILIPLLTALFDISENIAIAYLAFTFNGEASPIAYLASFFTSIKLILFPACLVVLVIGAGISIYKNKKSTTN